MDEEREKEKESLIRRRFLRQIMFSALSLKALNLWTLRNKMGRATNEDRGAYIDIESNNAKIASQIKSGIYWNANMNNTLNYQAFSTNGDVGLIKLNPDSESYRVLEIDNNINYKFENDRKQDIVFIREEGQTYAELYDVDDLELNNSNNFYEPINASLTLKSEEELDEAQIVSQLNNMLESNQSSTNDSI